MSKVALMTDTTSNMPKTWIERYGIYIVPVYVIFGNESYRDYVDMPAEEFYRRLQAAEEMPKTSQPTPTDFVHAYKAAQANGATDVIGVYVTAKASGTCTSAQLAADMVEGLNVHVVDSASTSLPMSWMLVEAAKALEQGGSAEEALQAVEKVKANNALVFTVTEVKHLVHSGRTIGAERAAQAQVKVKPIVSLEDGRPQAVGTERTQRSALNRVINLVKEKLGGRKLKGLGVVHGGIEEKGKAFAQDVKKAFAYDGDVVVVDFGPALAVHFGPGLLGVAAYWEEGEAH